MNDNDLKKQQIIDRIKAIRAEEAARHKRIADVGAEMGELGGGSIPSNLVHNDLPANVIEKAGGSRKQLERTQPIAGTLSEVLDKIKEKGGGVTKSISNPKLYKAKKLLSMVPGLGTAIGVAEALHSGDVSAAIPILDSAESVGQGSDIITPEMRADRQKDEELRAKLEALKMARQLGGPADVNPKQALQATGEQQEPDTDGQDIQRFNIFNRLRNSFK